MNKLTEEEFSALVGLRKADRSCTAFKSLRCTTTAATFEGLLLPPENWNVFGFEKITKAGRQGSFAHVSCELRDAEKTLSLILTLIFMNKNRWRKQIWILTNGSQAFLVTWPCRTMAFDFDWLFFDPLFTLGFRLKIVRACERRWVLHAIFQGRFESLELWIVFRIQIKAFAIIQYTIKQTNSTLQDKIVWGFGKISFRFTCKLSVNFTVKVPY
jgi:hypothetical protein